MLVAGSDASGTNEIGNCTFMVLVIGEQNYIQKIHKKIGVQKIHMAVLPKKLQAKVIKNLSFDNILIKGFCIYVDRDETINFIMRHKKLKGKYRSKRALTSYFDKKLRVEVREIINQFAIKNGTTFSSLIVQCDGDTEEIIKTWGLKTVVKDKAHELSDALAWCNNHSISIGGTKELFLGKKLHNLMIEKVLK